MGGRGVIRQLLQFFPSESHDHTSCADFTDHIERTPILFQATLGMKGVKEMKALLDILDLDSSVYVRIQVRLLVASNC